MKKFRLNSIKSLENKEIKNQILTKYSTEVKEVGGDNEDAVDGGGHTKFGLNFSKS